MELLTMLTILVNFILIQGISDAAYADVSSKNYTHLKIYENAIARGHYNPWTCSYRSEPGYRCLSCTAALHCFPTDFALLVQCAGFFPYCRNGYCSMWKTEGCNEDFTFAEGTHGPSRLTTPPEMTSILTEEHSSTETTQGIPDKIENMDGLELTNSSKIEENTVKNDTIDTEKEPNIVKHTR